MENGYTTLDGSVVDASELTPEELVFLDRLVEAFERCEPYPNFINRIFASGSPVLGDGATEKRQGFSAVYDLCPPCGK